MTARCLALLVLALGLVLMHHTVIEAPPATAASSIGHEHTVAVGPSPATAAGHQDEHHGEHHGAMMLHLCLAVLAALGVLLSTAVHGRLRLPSDDDRDDGAPVRVAPAPAPPPPVPLRLARLQILRL